MYRVFEIIVIGIQNWLSQFHKIDIVLMLEGGIREIIYFLYIIDFSTFSFQQRCHDDVFIGYKSYPTLTLNCFLYKHNRF